MKKRLLAGLLVLLATGLMVCCLWACAAPQQAQPKKESAASEQSANATDEAQRIKMLPPEEKVAASKEFYAPKVTTLPDGTEVQKTPADPYMWNTAILQGDNRGCLAEGCHTDLLKTPQLLPMSHPELKNPYNIDPSIKFCYMCHSKALFMQDSMHALHMNNDKFKGDCNSCHYIDPATGNHMMWDLAKYDTAFMGITSIPNVKGDFSFTQDSITPTDQVFYYWENANHQGVTPKNDTSADAYKNWEIKVTGEVNNSFSFKLGEMEDQMVEKVMKMDCQTNPPGGAYIANVKVKGVPLKAVMEKAGIKDTATAMHSIADDGWDVYPVPMSYVNDNIDNIMLVTEINGESLGMLQGYPVQLWTPDLAGCHYTKRPVELKFTTEKADPKLFIGFTNPKTGEMFNKPNTAVFNYTNGTVFPAGKAIEFEGFADAYDVPVTAVEISFDKGKTWTKHDLGTTDTLKWVNWKFSYTPEKAGSYLMKVRAISADGAVSTDPSQLFFNVK
ncbi:MAG: molybdopterin-dependent oxidoreductase [Raoultibacter sp.]